MKLYDQFGVRKWLLLCGMVFTAIPVQASGTISNALSAREAGRGGINLAFSDNGVILLDNPAGMQGLVGNCQCNDTFFDVGGVLLMTDLTYADDDNPVTGAADNPTGLGHLMFGRRLNEDVVVGLGAFAPAGFSSDYDLQGPAALPGDRNYFSFGALMRILPGFSFRMTDRWTVGGTLGVAASHVELEGPYFLNSAPFTGTPTLLDLQATGAALTWSLGTQIELTDRTTLGIRYQSENKFESDGKARVDIPALGGSANYDVNVGLTWARSVGIGLKHEMSRTRRIGIDFEWEDWSDAYDNATLIFTNSSNPNPPFSLTPIREIFPLRWKDALIVSTGFEQDLGCGRTVRCGYRFQENPIPAYTTSTFLQTTLEHHFSVGYGFQLCDWEIDTAYQYAFGRDVDTATSAYPGGDFSNAEFTTQTHMLFFSFIHRH